MTAAAERKEEKEGDHRYHAQEMKAKEQFDGHARKLAERFKINYDNLMWLELS